MMPATVFGLQLERKRRALDKIPKDLYVLKDFHIFIFPKFKSCVELPILIVDIYYYNIIP